MPGVRTMFLIDGCGAVLSALMLGVVLPGLPEYFSFPSSVLGFLSGFATAFAVGSLGCYLLNVKKPGVLRGIAICNGCYALLTTGLLAFHHANLTVWDLCYFTGEILILAVLVYYEIQVAANAVQLSVHE